MKPFSGPCKNKTEFPLHCSRLKIALLLSKIQTLLDIHVERPMFLYDFNQMSREFR
jgi:hypothetical protein